MRVALICDWLTAMRGGERCLQAICEIYPGADIFALVHHRGSVSKIIESHNIYTSYIQRLPGNGKLFRFYLPFFAHSMRRFDLSGYDFVISLSHCAAHNVRVPQGIPHICYCHTPMRYAWHMRHEYTRRYTGLKKLAAEIMLNYLKKRDREASEGVTHFVANSENVRRRIKDAYNRDSIVIYPPISLERFSVCCQDEDYYLIVSALVPYKRVDLAVRAFSGFDGKLVVIGSGPELSHLKNMASDRVSIIDKASDAEVTCYLQKCRALIFPGEEDFGIVPLEAQACGKAVIAFDKGGIKETVIAYDPGKSAEENAKATGLFFYEQSVKALRKAIMDFESLKNDFCPEACRENACRFSDLRYRQQMEEYISSVMGGLKS